MKILIVGAGRTGCSLIEALARKNYDITIIEKDKKTVEAITDKYNVSGFTGSGASKESLLAAGADTADILFALTPIDEINLLSCMQAKRVGTLRCVARVSQPDFAAERKTLEAEEGIASADVVVSLTNSDETNMVTSMYAWARNVPSILTRVDAPGHLNLLHKVNLDITLSSSEISVNKLVRFIHNWEAGDAPNQIEKYCSVAENKAEIIQFTAGDDFIKPGVCFKETSFKLKKNTLIASVVRDGELVMPSGFTYIQKGDKVIVISDKKNHIENLNEIFA